MVERVWNYIKSRTIGELTLLAGGAIAVSVAGVANIAGPIIGMGQKLESFPGSIVAEVVKELPGMPGRSGRHLGFDTNIYPGDKVMAAWKGADSPYEWVGFYLPAPCHKDKTWSGKRATLERMGWGIAVIYVGQQTWGKAPGARRMKPIKVMRRERVKIRRKGRIYTVNKLIARTQWIAEPPPRADAACAVDFVHGARGVSEGHDAINKTLAEGFEMGSTIFLDIEHMDFVPTRMRDYYRAWTATVLSDGRFKPGYYVHTRNAETVYTDIKGVFEVAGFKGEPSFWVAGKSHLFDGELGPEHVGHAFAGVWQGLLDKVDVRSGYELPVDINVAKVPNPSAKEYAITE